ncbi:hypothetical protein ACFFV7_50490 [Nonomuraea spiralis]|uniref:Uncharacterized protein n=1 Tax=Nonomuraea spiralis TaxID=46182 RepID=A0ABV5IY69_9ACTN|nr:hypothetical protein [Nonomuraea spiralis]
MSDVVLVDMDGVIADFDIGFNVAWSERFPERKLIHFDERRSVRISDDYPEQYMADIYDILTSRGFIRSLPEVDGAVHALGEMLAIGFSVYICTSPLSPYGNNVEEKYEWIERHLGRAWMKRLIVSKDKTLIRGKYLVDNAPTVDGLLEPTWEHVVFDRPYNRAVCSRRRLTWPNWKSVVCR